MLNTLKDKRLGFLEVGQEYFKAIVTSQPIVSWLSFLNSDITQASEYETLLATKTLQLSVVSYQSSVISYQLSVISYQSSVISHQLSINPKQLRKTHEIIRASLRIATT